MNRRTSFRSGWGDVVLSYPFQPRLPSQLIEADRKKEDLQVPPLPSSVSKKTISARTNGLSVPPWPAPFTGSRGPGSFFWSLTWYSVAYVCHRWWPSKYWCCLVVSEGEGSEAIDFVAGWRRSMTRPIVAPMTSSSPITVENESQHADRELAASSVYIYSRATPA